MNLYTTFGLWHKITGKPLLTHEDLQPIMKDLGFVMRKGRVTWFDGVRVEWTEYRYKINVQPMEMKKKLSNIKEELPSKTCPVVELPLNSIHGLHPFTYQAFGHAMDYYHKHSSDSTTTKDFEVSRVLFGVNDQDFNYIWMHAEQFGEEFIHHHGTLDPGLLSRYQYEDGEIKDILMPETNARKD